MGSLTIPQLVEKFPAFYRPQRFITVFTTALLSGLRLRPIRSQQFHFFCCTVSAYSSSTQNSTSTSDEPDSRIGWSRLTLMPFKMKNLRLSLRYWRGFFPWRWRHHDPSKCLEPLNRHGVTSHRSCILASSPAWVLFHKGVNCQGDQRRWSKVNEHGALMEWYWQGKTDTWGKPCPSDIMYTTITKRTDLGSNSDLRSDRSDSGHSGTATYFVREYRNLCTMWKCFTNKRENQLTVRLLCT